MHCTLQIEATSADRPSARWREWRSKMWKFWKAAVSAEATLLSGNSSLTSEAESSSVERSTPSLSHQLACVVSLLPTPSVGFCAHVKEMEKC